MKNLQFAIETGNKNIVIRFNESKKFHTVGENAPWETVPFMNAITHIMNRANPAYAVMDPGLYLHQTLEDIVNSLGNKNVGYCSHTVLLEMVEAGLIRRDLETKPGVYRLAWNGLYLTASDMPYRPWEVNEPAQVSHNRDAFRLFMAFETIRKAAEQGTNIRLLITKKFQARADLFVKHYAFFVAGDFEALAASVKAGIAKAATYETLKHYSNRSAAAVARGNGFALPESINTLKGTIATSDLLGKKVQFVFGTTTLPIEWTVTDGETVHDESIINAGDLVATMKDRGLKLHIVEDAPVAEKKSRTRRNAKMSDVATVTE